MADPSVESVEVEVELERADDELEFHSFAEKDYEFVAASIAELESTRGIEEKIVAVVRLIISAMNYPTVSFLFLDFSIIFSILSLLAQLQRYQEQPELLDPHLELIITPLMRIACRGMSDARPVALDACHRVFRVIYTLAKVRGYKTIGVCFLFA